MTTQMTTQKSANAYRFWSAAKLGAYISTFSFYICLARIGCWKILRPSISLREVLPIELLFTLLVSLLLAVVVSLAEYMAWGKIPPIELPNVDVDSDVERISDSAITKNFVVLPFLVLWNLGMFIRNFCIWLLMLLCTVYTLFTVFAFPESLDEDEL